MKKFLFVAAFATLVAAGCQKTEVINPVPEGTPMSFTTGLSKLTKAQGTVNADNTGQKNLEAQDFSVWAYADPQSDFSTSTIVDESTQIYDEMENLHIECTSASVDAVVGNGTAAEPETPAVAGTWTPANKKEYYWPGDAKDLRFFAVSADGSWLRAATCPVTINYDVPSMTINDFEVKAAPVMDNTDPDNPVVVKTAADEDLMVADYVKQNQSKKTVDLTFRHTLAKVEFIFKTLDPEGDDIYPDVWVQSLSMAGLKYKGDLEVQIDETVTERENAWKFTWKHDTETTVFTDDWAVNATYNTGAEAAVAADPTAMKLTLADQTFSTWLMMPQPITDANKVEITYVINKRQFKSVFSLAGEDNGTVSAWGHNQHIRYTVILAPNTISFVPTVQDWAPVQGVEHTN